MHTRGTTLDCSIALALALLTLVLARATPQLQIDDAYITYRYAYNLLEHGQLVWNQGEFIEGQTNLLWSLLLAIVSFLTNSEIPSVSQNLCLGLNATTTVLLFFIARHSGLNRGISLLLSLAFQMTPAAIGFSLAGLESALVATLTAAAVLASICRAPLKAALLAGLLFMARPDAAIIAIALAGINLAYNRSLPSLLRNWWPALLLGLATETFRALYYHALIPNSIVAKSLPLSLIVGEAWSNHTLPYLKDFLAWPSAWLFIVSCMLGLLATNKSQEAADIQRLGWLGGIVFAAALLMTVRNGGDWMENFRLISQYYPAYAASLCAYLATSDTRAPTVRLTVGGLVCSIAVTVSLASAWPQLSFRNAATMQKEIRIDPMYFSLPKRLEGLDLTGLTLSAEAAGYPFFALPNVKGHDPLGLLDPWLAHHGYPAITWGKFDLNYTFVQVQPDIALFHWAGHLQGITDRSGLLERYTIRCFSRCSSVTDARVVVLKKDLQPTLLQRFEDLPIWPGLATKD